MTENVVITAIFERNLFFSELISLMKAEGQRIVRKKTLSNLNDVDLTNKKGNIMILNFWATWCAPCKREMPSLEKLTNKFPQV